MRIGNDRLVVCLSEYVPCRPVEFKKQPCRMSLKPEKGSVAVSI